MPWFLEVSLQGLLRIFGVVMLQFECAHVGICHSFYEVVYQHQVMSQSSKPQGLELKLLAAFLIAQSERFTKQALGEASLQVFQSFSVIHTHVPLNDAAVFKERKCEYFEKLDSGRNFTDVNHR